MAHKFTQGEAEFLRTHVEGRGNIELTELFNTNLGLELSVKQIKAYKKNHGLSSGRDGRFQSGHVPANKGRKGVDGWAPTQFKKGCKPWNYLPVGSERVNGDGYLDIKIEDPNKWKGKHILIWENANGPVPTGHAVIFGDKDNRNFEVDNLILVSRKQLVRLNQHNLIQDNADLTKAGIIIADICNKIGERKRETSKDCTR